MLLSIHPENPNPRLVRQVTECLANGGLVVVPTDTVYGIACSLRHARAIESMAEIRNKKVKEANFSLLCSDISQISQFTKSLSTETFKLLKRNLPGPFTFILEANNQLTKVLRFSRKNVGVRIPAHNVPIEIIRLLEEPLVITSVKDPDDDIIEYLTNPELIWENLRGTVDMVIDSGIGGITPSTVVDCTGDEPVIVREGAGDLVW